MEEFYEDGKLKNERVLKNNKFCGYSKSYLPDGNLWLLSNHENDEEHGIQIQYFESGAIKEKSCKIKGSMDGLYECYYENGQLYYRHQRYKGKRHGIFEKYNEDGSVIKFEKYKNGLLIKENKSES